MTLLVWPGSKLECGLSNERNISERVDGSIHSSTVMSLLHRDDTSVKRVFLSFPPPARSPRL